MKKILDGNDEAKVGDYTVVGGVLAVAVPAPAPNASCGTCCFLPASGSTCRQAPACSSPNVRFKKIPKTSNTYLLLRLKGEI